LIPSPAAGLAPDRGNNKFALAGGISQPDGQDQCRLDAQASVAKAKAGTADSTSASEDFAHFPNYQQTNNVARGTIFGHKKPARKSSTFCERTLRWGHSRQCLPVFG